MILASSLVALAALQAQASEPAVALFPPKPVDVAAPGDFMNWHGWAYLHGAAATWPKIYETSGDWTAIQAKYLAISAQPQGAASAKTPEWRLKVVVFTRAESDERDASGVLRELRGTIESTQLDSIRMTLARFVAYVSAKFDGAVTIVPDVSVEPEWMRDSGADAFGPKFARRYFEARINGGSYDAEDKVFRGPYNSAIYILPGSSTNGLLPDSVVNDTPVSAVPATPVRGNGITQSLDSALREAWFWQVEMRAREQGYAAAVLAPLQEAPGVVWATLTNLNDVPAQTFLSRLSTKLNNGGSVEDPPDRKEPILPATSVKLVSDAEKGQVLAVTETSSLREGGVALPATADGSPIDKVDEHPTLTFAVKSSSGDPMAIRLDSSLGTAAWICLGRDVPLVHPAPGAVVASVAFEPDGKWHTVAVDVRSLAKQAALTDIKDMAIEPTPNCKLAGKQRAEPIAYQFADFAFSSDPASPLTAPVTAGATSDDPEARALFAAHATAPSPELAALLKDKNELVRLNATTAYIGFKDRTVEDALISNSLDLDPSVAGAALAALMAEGSDKAVAVVRNSIHVSLSEYAKSVAAKLVGDTKDPKAADDLSSLVAGRSWQAQVAAVHALAEIPGPDSQVFRLAYLGLNDPAVKLAVVEESDPSVDKVVSPLMWSAVNEPSDMVRAESNIKLIQAPSQATRAEGYKGVRDDSRFARKVVVEYLIAHPSEENRNALRIAIADRSPQVRALALEGFAALEKGATADEIANVIDDPDPTVQLALIDFAKRVKLKLPDSTVQAMLSSPDKRVSTAAQSLRT